MPAPSSPLRPKSQRLPIRLFPALSTLRTSTPPQLADIKLSHILDNETCPPISFNDFATFTVNKEFTSENLLFVLWFQSYRERWQRVAEEKRAKVPVPSTKLGDRCHPFRYLDERTDAGQAEPCPNRPALSALPPSPNGTSDTSASAISKPSGPITTAALGPTQREDRSGSESSPKRPPSSASRKGLWGRLRSVKARTASVPSGPVEEEPLAPSDPRLPPPDTVFDPPANQPLRDEAVRAFATFVNHGGSKGLGISDDLRQFSRTSLQRSSAPEVFLPIYDEIYYAIETQSLPHFLQYAKGNVNTPKMIFWYIVGAIDFLIGLAIFLVLTLLLSERHFAYRAIRLPSTIFVWFGVAQMYSAYRRFCSQVWNRRSAQLRPWEMDPGDEEQIMVSSEAGSSRQRLTTPPDMVQVRHGPGAGDDRHRAAATPASEQGISLPSEIYPLTDVSGAALAGSEEDLPWGRPVRYVEDDMDEEMRGRLTVRRDTLKAPDASLAFPINDPSGPAHGSTSHFTDVIFSSPFGAGQSDDTHTGLGLSVTPDVPLNHADTRQSGSKIPSTQDLRSLIHTIEVGTSGRPIGKPKVFGPERVVEDPRVTRLYDSIVRDITIVATVFGVVWIGVCFAVPTAGLG